MALPLPTSLSPSFRPHATRLCDCCACRDFCPAFGGGPAQASRVPAGVRAAAG